VPEAIIQHHHGATFGIITVGGCDPACREAIDILESQGVAANYMRVRGFPFGKEVEQFIAEQDFCYVVEQNRDGQLRSLLVLETRAPKEKLRSILVYAGFPLSAKSVVEGIQHKKSKKKVATKDMVMMEE
jgi:2-oxoglutarate ferredoxin oxidoreductase subunit alpha